MALIRLTITLSEDDLTGASPGADSAPAYVYSHAEHGEGVCPMCAPWLGVETTGDGDDGVPIPPQHQRCKCYLMPVDAAERSASGDEVNNEAMQWMESLEPADLRAVLGDVRADLIASGEVDLAEMYHEGRPLTLAEMGYNRAGSPIDEAGNVVKRNGPAFHIGS